MNDTSPSWRRFRDDIQARLRASAVAEVARASWNAEQIQRAQRDGLNRLLRHAVEHSPFHRRRLAGIDLKDVDPTDLGALPVMTKTQMMAELDDVYTDRRLHRGAVESALAATGTEPIVICGDYVALASGGCSGRRGVFVLDRATVAAFIASMTRQPGMPAVAEPPREQIRMASVASESPVHATGLLAALASSGEAPVRIWPISATLPLDDIVDRLNDLAPEALTGYASMLVSLAAEAQVGRLRIAPAAVSSTSETLLPEMRSVIRETFGAPVFDGFGSSEGLVGRTAPDGDTFVFNTDVCIAEIVDAENRPVPPGVPGAKVLVTNLANVTQPLIRYELADVFTEADDPAAHGYLQARVAGRADDVLHYGAVSVHPIVIRSVLVNTPEVIDYQAVQTPTGIELLAVTADRGLDGLTERLRRALDDSGLPDPDVTVRPVQRLERQPGSGKLRRFVPLAALPVRGNGQHKS